MEAEGLRPLAARSGIPVGQIPSLLDGRAVRVTTLESMTAVLGVRLTIGPETGGDLRSVWDVTRRIVSARQHPTT